MFDLVCPVALLCSYFALSATGNGVSNEAATFSKYLLFFMIGPLTVGYRIQ